MAYYRRGSLVILTAVVAATFFFWEKKKMSSDYGVSPWRTPVAGHGTSNITGMGGDFTAETVRQSGFTVCDTVDRVQRVKTECWKQSLRDVAVLSDSQTYQNILVDDLHKVLYCFIPKVACTTFKLFMVYSTLGKNYSSLTSSFKGGGWHNPKNLDPIGLRSLASFSQKERRQKLEGYFKFMVVRHPFDRLASAYSDKYDFEGFDPEGSMIQKANLQKYLNATAVRLSFPTFLHLVAKEGHGKGWFKNIHWSTYIGRCHPCEIEYDQIVRLETIQNDVSRVLAQFSDSNGPMVDIGSLHVSQQESPEEKIVRLFQKYKNIDNNTINSLLGVYKNDFNVFGYHWDPENSKASCNFRSPTGKDVCC